MSVEMDCRELVEIVTEYLEAALDEQDVAAIESHIRGCPACVEYIEQMRTVIALTGRLTTADISPAAEDALLEVFRNARRA